MYRGGRKDGKPPNGVKIKAIRSLSLAAERQIHPDSTIRVHSKRRKQEQKGTINVLFLVGIAAGIERPQQQHCMENNHDLKKNKITVGPSPAFRQTL